jgi:hypothetical protein
MRMYINEDYPSGIVPLTPSGTNSTLFTECCGCAICDDEANCPECGRKVIGYDAESKSERHRIRWEDATSRWKK